MKALLASLLVAMVLNTSAAAELGLRIEASEPRAYGYQVGDLVQRDVRLFVPSGWRLDDTSVPRPGGRGQALELRQVDLRSQRDHAGLRYELKLVYQVFLSPASVRTLEIAAIRLRFEGEGRIEEQLVEAWPVTVAPLAPAVAAARRGLGELQPDRAPPLIATTNMRLRLLACATLVTLLLAWLAWAFMGPPWAAARRQPFGLAWRELRQLPLQPGAEQWRAALVNFHHALNRSAGEVLLAPSLERFVAAKPAFRGLRADLLHFMQASRAEFFDPAARPALESRWLVELSRRCRDAERGLT